MKNYKILKNESINKWILTDVRKEKYIHKPDIMKFEGFDKKCGFTHRTYPCREQFLKNHSLEKVMFPSSKQFTEYYLEDNNKVEFTTFIPVATYISSFAKTTFKTEDEIVNFKITTCGGVKIWHNGKLISTFENYTRNTAKTYLFNVVTEVENELIIFFDELIERDGNYYFELVSTSSDLDIKLECDSLRSEELIRISNCIDRGFLDKTVYTDGPITLKLPEPLGYDFNLEVVATADFISHYRVEKSLQVSPEQTDIVLFDVSELQSDYSFFELKFIYKSFNKVYRVSAEVFNKKLIDSLDVKNDSMEVRTSNYFNAICEDGDPNSFSMIALLELSKYEEKFIKYFEFEEKRIKNHEDCSDFYLIPLVHILLSYGDHPFVTDDIKVRILTLIRNFRFWYDEPGDDVMWYFSENHALLFYCLKYVCGKNFSNMDFENSGNKGTVLEQNGRERVEKWLDEFLVGGLVEWNSTSYIPIDFIGLGFLKIYGDDEIQEKATKCIDILFEVVNEYSRSGNMNGATQGRAYEKALKAKYSDPISVLNYLYYNTGQLNGFAKGIIMLICAKYESKKIDQKAYSTRIHGDIQKVKTEVYKFPKYMISAVKDYYPGAAGYQEHIAALSFGDNINIWVNHPGEENIIGHNRPSFWGGNGKNPNIEIGENLISYRFDLDEESLFPGYTHAHFPIDQFEEYALEEYRATILDNGLKIIIECNYKLEFIENGASALHELRAYGYNPRWEIRVYECR